MPRLNLSLELRGGGTLTDSSGISPATERATIGGGGFDQIAFDLGSGTGDEQGNQWYLGQRTLSATTGENLDLQSLANKLGTAVLTKVRGLLIRILSPDGTKYLKVGPQAQANGWQGPFSTTGSDGWIRVDWLTFLACGFGNGIGAVSGSNKVLRVYNPGAGSVTYDIFLVGVA